LHLIVTEAPRPGLHSASEAVAAPRVLAAGAYRLSLERPLVMGIVNVTPDSFSDAGRHALSDVAIAHARQQIADGADIVDIGGESTRPGAAAIDEHEELRRVLPVLEALAGCGKPVSVDTRKPAVMRRAIAAGAAMINDIAALRAPGALDAVADSNAAVCLMHMQGEPATMQQEPRYGDVVAEVRAFLRERIDACRAAGIAGERLVIDPGFGFGKTLEHNILLLAGLRAFTALGVPVLAGLSRKGSLGMITGRPVGERVAASVAAALAAVARGATIVRVHDVAPTVDALKVWNEVAAAERATAQGPMGSDGT
jgi:dihydropteroate synthase